VDGADTQLEILTPDADPAPSGASNTSHADEEQL
jgi:hypothetical protein